MDHSVHIGIECDDLEWRVVYVMDGVAHWMRSEVPTPILVFVPSESQGGWGTRFQGLVRCLGSHLSLQHAGAIRSVEQAAERQFETIVTRLQRQTGRSIGHAVLGVPSFLNQTARSAILTAAQNGGLSKVSLVDRCTAIGLAHQYNTQPSETRTTLVMDLGYGGFEFSLLRLGRGRCKVVASGGSSRVSGAALNAALIEGLTLAARKYGVQLGLDRYTVQQWADLWLLAERTRDALTREPEAVVTLHPGTRVLAPIRVRVSAERFAHRIAPFIKEVAEAIQATLEEHQLESRDLHTVLLSGRAASRPPMFGLLAAQLSTLPLQRADLLLTAVGAAWQACQTAGAMLGDGPSPLCGDEDLNVAATTAAVSMNADDEFAEMVDPPAQTSEGEDGGADTLDGIRRLIEAGRRAEALAALETLIGEAQDLQNDVRQLEQAPAREMVKRALALVRTGEYMRAVTLSHRAYNHDRNDADVFAGMMEVHAAAGLAMSREDEYEDAVSILQCAHGHDQTDRAIHRALAKRYLLQAEAQRRGGDLAGALEAVLKSLRYDPKDAEANALRADIATAIERSA